MVEALAKARYLDGIQLEYGHGVAEDCHRTLDQLAKESVTVFEATLLVGRRHARVDILDKKGKNVRLIEVKSKSFNGAQHAQLLAEGKAGALRGTRKPHRILNEWLQKLEDITYQVLLLEKALPHVVITPLLALIDKSKIARIDNIPGLFELKRQSSSNGRVTFATARYVGSHEQLLDLDLVSEVDVSEEVSILREHVARAAALFESRLDAPLAEHARDLPRGSKCVQCEFRVDVDVAKNGFAECWGPLSAPKPHMLELFSIGTAKALDGGPLIDWMFQQQRASLFDIPEECLVKANGSVGPTAERQRRQIEFTKRAEIFVSSNLRARIESLRSPFHFIDFETSRLALPYHRDMNPYGLVAFQWSCHTVNANGQRPRHAEWLNNIDVWPNRSFVESLRESIGDKGTVLTWSHYEATTLKQIIADLERFGHDCPDLVAWMTDVVENRIVDMHDWARYDYYHPGMRGRTSIKIVLDALWKSDAAMREQFQTWSAWPAEPARDPYDCLPPVEIAGVLQDVHEGTGAMRAYQEMMYGSEKNDPVTKAMWSALLRRYCELDTLSMVLILEHWRRCVGVA
jgi:hypothetical protein